MRKQVWKFLGDLSKPVFCPSSMVLKPFVFPCRPQTELAVDVTQCRVHGGFIETTIVVYPALYLSPEHSGQIRKVFVTAQMQLPAPYLLSDGLTRLGAHRWCKVYEVLSPSVLQPPRAKCIPKKVKAGDRMHFSTIIIFAVNNLLFFCVVVINPHRKRILRRLFLTLKIIRKPESVTS